MFSAKEIRNVFFSFLGASKEKGSDCKTSFFYCNQRNIRCGDNYCQNDMELVVKTNNKTSSHYFDINRHPLLLQFNLITFTRFAVFLSILT